MTAHIYSVAMQGSPQKEHLGQIQAMLQCYTSADAAEMHIWMTQCVYLSHLVSSSWVVFSIQG